VIEYEEPILKYLEEPICQDFGGDCDERIKHWFSKLVGKKLCKDDYFWLWNLVYKLLPVPNPSYNVTE
jgi:hypothetical protein